MSDKPVAERLQVKGARRLAVLNPPAGLDQAVGADRAETGLADVVLLFVADKSEWDALVPPALTQIRADAVLWVAYPKLTSKRAGDLSRDIIHKVSPAFGLDTVAQIAIDEDWSALRFKRI